MEISKISRTEWAEQKMEELLSIPFISEFVFRSPKHNDPNEKEVCDHLIVHSGQSILISQKAQEDPDRRTVERNKLWVEKNIKNALKQICGVIRNPNYRPKWCEHPRRGRVEFDPIPPIIHGIVLVETCYPVDLSSLVNELPMEYVKIPLTYLSINDFLNLVVHLRTVPELLKYLTDRRSLSESSLRIVGDEYTLFKLYLMNGGNFEGCNCHDDARQKLAKNENAVNEALARNEEYRSYGGLLEHVANELAFRDPEYRRGLPIYLLSQFDTDGERKNYIILQEILVDMRLRERAELGRAFHSVIEHVSMKGEGFSFKISHIDGKDMVFLFIAARKVNIEEIFRRTIILTNAAQAYFIKKRCMAIVDRDGEHYDLILTPLDYKPTAEDEDAGRKYFGSLRMYDVDMSRL